MLDRVLDAAEGVIIHQIARGADDEELPDALIEDDLRRGPRICASHNDGKRMLRLRGGRTALGDRLARAHLALSEALVPGLQTAEGLVGGDLMERQDQRPSPRC